MPVLVAIFIEAMRRFQKCDRQHGRTTFGTTLRSESYISPSKRQEARSNCADTHASVNSALPHQLKAFPRTLSWSPGALPSHSSISRK
ncbi:hypothetical protein BC826DRAFT_1047756 [Russula brevipes]|nr:hypothetical protein BC826DRAFT_1047756 [Russula brevipes]